jgi:hypothetical protein
MYFDFSKLRIYFCVSSVLFSCKLLSMVRPKAKKTHDGILHVRCYQEMLTRLKQIAEKNHRSASGEAIHAIEEYLHAEEIRLGLKSSNNPAAK